MKYSGVFLNMPGRKKCLCTGVIEVGSKALKLTIGALENGQVKILHTVKKLVDFGADTASRGRISRDNINKTITVLRDFKGILSEYDAKCSRVIGTTAVREASNRDIFIDTVFRATGFQIEVFSVDDIVYYIDSHINYRLGSKYPIASQNILVVEIGYGTLDFSIMQKGCITANVGLPLGINQLMRLLKKSSRLGRGAVQGIREFIENEINYIKRLTRDLQIDDLLLIEENFGSCVESIMKIRRKNPLFYRFTKEESAVLMEKANEKCPDELMLFYNMPQEYAENVGIVSTLVNAVFTLVRRKHIYVSESSLIEAMVAHSLLGATLFKKFKRSDHYISVAGEIAKRFNTDANHVKFVAKTASTMFDALWEIMGLKKTDRIYLVLAAYLHDIGKFISNRAHHKHSEYLINTLNFFAIGREDLKVIAAVARYHRKSPPNEKHPLYQSLDPYRKLKVQKLSSILRIANALDTAHMQKVRKMTVKVLPDGIDIWVYVGANHFEFEEVAFDEKKDYFEEITGSSINLKVENDWIKSE